MSQTTHAPSAAAGPGETIMTPDRVVACDGGEGAHGHPRVWLRIVHAETTCPYCSRRYVLTGDGAEHGH